MLFYFADLEQQITSLGVKTVVYATIILIVATVLAALTKDRLPKLKLPIFLVMAITLVGATLTLLGSTVYLNMKSESKGPVHWHTEIEFWACNAELELRDPHGFLSNKIGTATYHEHNDKHIHLEGVVVRKTEDASLEKFMRVTGGYLQPDAIGVPLNDDPSEWYAQGDQTDGDKQSLDAADQLKTYVKTGKDGPVMELVNGRQCDTDNAELQVFVYRFNKEDDTYRQEKLADPTSYVMSTDSSLGPPSDCVIVEYDAPKDRTDKLCEQYGVKDSKRCTEFGVKSYKPDLCYIKEITNPTETTSDTQDSTEPSNDTDAAARAARLATVCEAQRVDPRSGSDSNTQCAGYDSASSACQDYLRHYGDPEYRPGLSQSQIEDCVKKVLNEKEEN